MAKRVARLFQQFQPEHYNLSLLPDREGMTFSGTVTIRGKKFGRPSKRLTFHQKDLSISAAKITKHEKSGDVSIPVLRTNKQKTLDELRIHTDELLYPGDYTITLEFSGKITKPMNGIYPCNYRHDGKDKLIIASQFESHHAREAFPCIDEPEAKATFDLSLTTPKGETVLSNTPIKKQTTHGSSVLTLFETTPKMSVYLLAFAYGELGYSESVTKTGTIVRSYATPDNVKITKYSVDVGVKILEFFEEYFAVPYPLPKLDMVALPDFSVGAMENWGLVTFRETTLLADPAISSIESQQIVALVVAHELSHQWFGNLVTMKWWDDLWLNESFANMMEYRAVDAIFPEWHIWETFVSQETGSAMRRDSLADVQPVHIAVNHPDEINTIFDPSIVYAKGGSILHMLMHHIGEDTFRTGLKKYFQKHAYANTTADDLWAALGEAADEDIGAFMQDWLTRPGFPIVSIAWLPGDWSVKLSQRRFLSDPSVAVSDDKAWPVPLASTAKLEPNTFTQTNGQVRITEQTTPLLFNHEGHSYFLPRYSESLHLKQIVKAIKTEAVSTTDRLLLLNNYLMLQRGGIVGTTELLELLSGYVNEKETSVWGSMAQTIGETRKLIEGSEQSENKLNELSLSLLGDLPTNLGWEDRSGDSPQALRLRGLVHSLAASAKSKVVLDEGLAKYQNFSKPADLLPSTRTVIYFIGVRYGTMADFDKLLDLHGTTINADEKEEIAGALTSAKDPQRIAKLIKLLKSDEIRRQDLMHWYVWLLRNRYSRQATWQWLVENWDWVEQEFSSDKNYSAFARYSGAIFSTQEELVQFKQLFDSKRDIIAMQRDITLAEQEISGRVAWRERNEDAVKQWLDAL